MSPAAELQLFLLRHADAGDPETWRGADADRPLSPKGERQAERLGTFLAKLGFRPGAIISSPKVRAARTAEIVGAAVGVDVRLDERLAGGVGPDLVDAILGDAGTPDRPILTGHDPDFSELLAWLAHADGVTMKKGAFARIDVKGRVADGRGTLRWLLPPDLLEGT